MAARPFAPASRRGSGRIPVSPADTTTAGFSTSRPDTVPGEATVTVTLAPPPLMTTRARPGPHGALSPPPAAATATAARSARPPSTGTGVRARFAMATVLLHAGT